MKIEMATRTKQTTATAHVEVSSNDRRSAAAAIDYSSRDLSMVKLIG